MANLFYLDRDGGLSEMRLEPYDDEAHVQRLLEQHPQILAGEQFSSSSPRRWALVKREAGVSDGEGGRWSLDHLLLDQDAIPTLVEVKLGRNREARRQVVGQMLDYAANGPSHWPISQIRQWFESSQRSAGRDPGQALEELASEEFAVGEAGPEGYWSQVAANLAEGRIRMVFVVDELPPQLERIVEFLSRQMTTAEVFAVQVRHLRSDAGTILETEVRGQTPASRGRAMRSAATSGERMTVEDWQRRFLEPLSDEERVAGRAVVSWMAGNGELFCTPHQAKPSLGVRVLDQQGQRRYPLQLKANGNVKVGIDWLSRAGVAVGNEASQRAWAERIGSIDGLAFRQAHPKGEMNMALSALVDSRIRGEFLAAMDELIEAIEQGWAYEAPQTKEAHAAQEVE